jgi:hypothetical protein
MRGEHASTVQALIYWLERREILGEVSHQNYEMLAGIADRWDIPLLIRDIDVIATWSNMANVAIPLCGERTQSSIMDFRASL